MSHWEKLTLLDTKSEQLLEFKKKYLGCYIWATFPNKQPKLCQLHSEESLFVLEDIVTGNLYKIVYETKVELSASFPTTKLVNHNKAFCLFTRIPARQYCKAPNKDNCTALNILPGTTIISFTQILLEAFSPTYYDVPVALEMLEKDHIGVAINQVYGISLNPNTDDNLLLWRYDAHIGMIRDNEIRPTHPVFYQECLDFVKRVNLDWKVYAHV